MTIKRDRTDRFRIAIVNSLRELEQRGAPITKKAVIDNARFENGKPVGKSTLFSRHERTGELVHADLHKEIDAVQQSQRKRTGGATRNESIAELKQKITDLRSENRGLTDAVVSQEARLQEMRRKLSSEGSVRSRMDYDMFVLAKTADQLADGSIPEIADLVSKLEARWRNAPLMTSVLQEVENYLATVKKSRVVSLKATKKIGV